jgi:large subunit ribosomal protein L23
MLIDTPVITEKSLQHAQNGVYTFAVAKTATKSEIAKLVAKLYSVEVTSVRVQSVKGKAVRRKTGIFKENDWKKALVTVKKGQAIKEFELPEQKEAEHDHSHEGHDHAGHDHK